MWNGNGSDRGQRGPSQPARPVKADGVCPCCGSLARKGRCLLLADARKGVYTAAFAARIEAQHGASERKAS